MNELKLDKYKVMCDFLLELLIRGELNSGYINNVVLARARRWNLVFHKGMELTPYGHEFLRKHKDLV